MSTSLTVRPARVADAAQMARVNVRCWQETYRKLMADALLDDPGFPAARERFWTAALTDGRYLDNRVAVAEHDGELVGIAMSGPPLDAAAAWARRLYTLYVVAADHGTGAGPGGGGVCGEPTNRMRDQVVATHRPRGDDEAVRLCGWRSPTRRSGYAG